MTAMRIDSRFLNWGVFFILLGLVPLAVQQGWIPDDAVSGWWRFWPLILIGIGVGLLLRHTAAHFLGGTLVAVTCGLMFGSLVAAGVGGNIGFACDQNRAGTPFASQAGTLSGASAVELVMNCGKLIMTANPGNAWTLAGSGPDGRMPGVTTESTGSRSRPPTRTSSSRSTRRPTWTVGPADRPDADRVHDAQCRFRAARPGRAPCRRLSRTTNAGKTTIDFSGTTLRRLSYTVNAGSTLITLPAASMSGSATVNAGSLGLCVAPGTGVRIESGSVLASNNYAQRGLVQTGSTWTSPGYATAAVQVDLSISANAGSVELDPAGGCK